jgi:hypothetical protein
VTTVVFAIGDALGDALVRPGHVVVHLVFSQDRAQMAFPDDQHAVQELTAQGTDEALADRVHPGSPDGRPQDPGPGGPEDSAERGSEVRSPIADEEPDIPEPAAQADSEVAGPLHRPAPAGHAVTPPRCIRRVPCPVNTSTYRRLNSTVSTCRKATATIPAVRAARNCRHAGLHQLAVEPPVSPQRILPRQADNKAGDARGRRQAPRPAPPARVILARCQPAVPGQQRRGRDGEDSGPAPARSPRNTRTTRTSTRYVST